MGSLAPFLVLALAMALLAGALVLSYQAAQRRRERIASWALTHGWAYVGTDPTLLRRWTGSPFSGGDTNRRVGEVLRGTVRGRPVTSFTFSYDVVTTTTDANGHPSTSRRTESFHVLAMDLPAYLPTLELTPEGIGAKIAKALGGADVQFESAAFNSAWRVVSRDLKFAHDVVRPQLMERLMLADARGTSLRVEGPTLLSWTDGRTVLDHIGPRAALLADIAESVPRFVWQDHGYDPLTITRPLESS